MSSMSSLFLNELHDESSFDSLVGSSNNNFEQHMRLLRPIRSMDLSSSPGMIAWFCFVVTVIVPITCCAFYCWFTRWSSHRRAQLALDRAFQIESDQIALSQMEANIQAFSELEKHRRTRSIRSAIRRNVLRVTDEDLDARRRRFNSDFSEDEGLTKRYSHALNDETTSASTTKTTTIADDDENRHEDVEISSHDIEDPSAQTLQLPDEASANESTDEAASMSEADAIHLTHRSESIPVERDPSSTSRLSSSVCNICLERFQSGDLVAHASATSSNCPHVFHEECIVAWFASRYDYIHFECPCCRQEFTLIKTFTPQTSVATSEGQHLPFFSSGGSSNSSIVDAPSNSRGDDGRQQRRQRNSNNLSQTLPTCPSQVRDNDDDVEDHHP